MTRASPLEADSQRLAGVQYLLHIAFMAYRVKLRRQGGSMAVTLPVEVVRRLAVREGAALYLVEDAPGEFRLTPFDPVVAAALEAHRAVTEEYRDVFRKLAE